MKQLADLILMKRVGEAAHARARQEWLPSSFPAVCAGGHDIYKEMWSPVRGERWSCSRESDNNEGPYAVAVMMASMIHSWIYPNKFSCIFTLLTKRWLFTELHGHQS